jgi:hypothetical protein
MFSSTETPPVSVPRRVFARQNLGKFLREISSLADTMLVWTSMLKRNAEPIAGHLFRGCRDPYDLLSQDEYSKIEFSPGKFFTIGMREMLCTKVLSEHLFTNISGNTSFTPDNTLLIDDSLAKGICNENGNAIFLALGIDTNGRTTSSWGNCCRGCTDLTRIASRVKCVDTWRRIESV